ncbi:TPA: hypothetical protein ACGR4A_001963 [Pseudomonas aeruginosa]
MSQKTQQDSMPIAEAVDLPEISVEHSTEFLTGSAPCAGVARPLPAAWLGQRGIYRSRFEAVCNGEQLVDPLTLGELIQRAWPSPSTELAERGTQHRFSTTEQTCRHDFYGVWWNDSGVTKTGRECRHCGFFVADMTEAAAEQAEAERPEVVAYADPVAFATFKERGHEGGVAGREWMWAEPGAALVAMSRTDECERIVGALRAKADQLREALEWRKENQAGQRELLRSVTAERDAALARVVELERQEPVAWMHDQPNRVDVIHRDVKDLLQRVPGSSRGIHRPLDVSEHYTIPLYAAPVAQAQHSVPEGWMLVECGIWTQEQVDEMQKTVARFRNSEFVDDRALAMAVADAGQCKAPEISLAELLAAAPGTEVPQAWLDVQSERRRQITAEGWTPEHDDLYCAAELPRAAAAYILNGANDEAPAIWPFVAKWWKPRDARSNYVRASALILAEIERLDRAAATQGGPRDA